MTKTWSVGDFFCWCLNHRSTLQPFDFPNESQTTNHGAESLCGLWISPSTPGRQTCRWKQLFFWICAFWNGLVISEQTRFYCHLCGYFAKVRQEKQMKDAWLCSWSDNKPLDGIPYRESASRSWMDYHCTSHHTGEKAHTPIKFTPNCFFRLLHSSTFACFLFQYFLCSGKGSVSAKTRQAQKKNPSWGIQHQTSKQREADRRAFLQERTNHWESSLSFWLMAAVICSCYVKLLWLSSNIKMSLISPALLSFKREIGREAKQCEISLWRFNVKQFSTQPLQKLRKWSAGTWGAVLCSLFVSRTATAGFK